MHELGLIALLAKKYRDLQRQFVSLSKQPGPQGEPGEKGKDGVNGTNGKDGLSISGEQGTRGDPGPRGKPGKDGKDGTDGKDGKDGKNGEDGKPPAHRWRGTKLAFKKPDGNWGREVDLQGPSGVRVISGGGGSSVAVIAPVEKVEHTDYTDTRYAYIGFESRTARIDYSVSPPLRETALSGDWANRLDLSYS